MLKGLFAAAVVFIFVLGTTATIANAGEANNLSNCFKLLESKDKNENAKGGQCIEQILAKEPNNPLALNNMAFVKVREKECKAALPYLYKARDQIKDYKIDEMVLGLAAQCQKDGQLAFFYAVKPAKEGGKTEDLKKVIVANIEALEKMTKTPSTTSKKGKK